MFCQTINSPYRITYGLVTGVSLIPSAAAGPKSILNNVILLWLLGKEDISDAVYIMEERLTCGEKS